MTPPPILAVPGYLPTNATGAAVPEMAGEWPDEVMRGLPWASERPSQFLANWVAVGTIDQALMAAVRLRNAHLRSAALMRSLLVVDEVHASDPYMTEILRNLLDQHLCAGGHALLMSATLGSDARAALLHPEVGRANQWRMKFDEAVAVPYPALWTNRAEAPVSIETGAGQGLREVQVRLEEAWSDPDAIASQAVAAARQGARVLVIRNTVREVVATQRALEAIDPALSLAVAGRACPHHARFAPEDRLQLDTALEALFGKNASHQGGRVAVTSQTAEQSLDIDADLLITDLCPADVLLQRLGRLHRHVRADRPAAFAAPVAVVLAPSEATLTTTLNDKGEIGTAVLALGLVYPDLLGILATRRALAEIPRLRIPADNRRLVERATHQDNLRELAKSLGDRWRARWGAHRGAVSASVRAAKQASLKWGEPISPFPHKSVETVAVRLGLNDRVIDLPPDTIGPFGYGRVEPDPERPVAGGRRSGNGARRETCG